MNKDIAYKLGYDCAKNGATEKNLNFGIFARREWKDAWERGAEDFNTKGD